MKWTSNQDFFQVDPVPTNQVWGLPTAWPTVAVADTSWQQDEDKKKRFAIELGKLKLINLSNAFKAACEVFGQDTNKALWAANNWLADPLVTAEFDLYVKTVETAGEPLDKEQFACKLLELAEAKIEINGKLFHEIVEPKDRLAYFRLYAEVKGYVGKTEVTNTNNFIHNEMKVKFVKPAVVEDQKTIDGEVLENQSVEPSEERFKIKLVS